MRIYTRRGDAGETSHFDGTRASKAHPRVAACGDVDELNAAVGAARSALDARLRDMDPVLRDVQRDLLALGALLGDPRRDGSLEPAGRATGDRAFDESATADLEPIIDGWEAELPKLTTFILPAGHAAAAALHVARTVARRAERQVVSVVGAGAGHPAAIAYLNRLSDLLFVAARLANHRAGIPDEPWT